MAGRQALLVPIVAALSLLVACGGGDGDATPAPAVTVLDTPAQPTVIAPAGDPGVTVELAVQACREKNADRLRSFVAGDVDASQIEALFARGSDVVLLLRTPPEIEDGHATVDVALEVTRERGPERVERTWELEQGDDGVWRFTSLPDCF